MLFRELREAKTDVLKENIFQKGLRHFKDTNQLFVDTLKGAIK